MHPKIQIVISLAKIIWHLFHGNHVSAEHFAEAIKPDVNSIVKSADQIDEQ